MKATYFGDKTVKSYEGNAYATDRPGFYMFRPSLDSHNGFLVHESELSFH